MRTARAIKRARRTSAAARQLRDLLRASILDSPSQSGHLPSDVELMTAYGTTRETVREALALLRREGIIDRVQGRGTFVTAVPSRLDLAAVISGRPAADAADAAGRAALTAREVVREQVPSPMLVAARLGTAPFVPCEREEYLLELDTTPVALVTEYLAASATDGPRSSDRWQEPDALGETAANVDSSVGCVAADDAVARRLGVADGAPLLVVEQVRRDHAGRGLSFAVMYFRPDRVLLRSRSRDNEPAS